MPAAVRRCRPCHIATLLALAACAADPDVVVLPDRLAPARDDAGIVDGGAGASCAAGDGCDAACPLLDVDCPDGVTCAADGLCTAGCFVIDSDCSPKPNGLPCATGEECQSGRCAFVDDGSGGAASCVAPCDDSGCPPPARCVDEVCVPASCHHAAAPSALGGALFLVRRHRRGDRSDRTAPPAPR